MSDFVTATPSIVGFTNGYGDRNGYGYNHGISDKDQMFAVDIAANERTRDLLESVYANGAANQLATEKIGAANILENAKNAAALHVQIATNAAAAQATAAANQQAAMMYANTNASTLAAQIAECCCEVKALILSTDAQRIRDELALLQTQFLVVTGGLTPSVAARRIS